jgi:hypothetical protein
MECLNNAFTKHFISLAFYSHLSVQRMRHVQNERVTDEPRLNLASTGKTDVSAGKGERAGREGG